MQGLRAPLQFGASAVSSATNNTGLSTAIPVGKNGEAPQYVYICADSAPGDGVRFMPVLTGETPIYATLIALLPSQPLVVNVSGFDAIRHQNSVGVAQITIAPLENIR